MRYSLSPPVLPVILTAAVLDYTLKYAVFNHTLYSLRVHRLAEVIPHPQSCSGGVDTFDLSFSDPIFF